MVWRKFGSESTTTGQYENAIQAQNTFYISLFSGDLIESCDLCLVIGTSSVVYPAAMFAPLVAERGKPVAEFNLNEEPANDLFQFHFPGPCGSTVPKALNV